MEAVGALMEALPREAYHILIVVAVFLAVESFVGKGPPRAFLLRLFKMDRKAGSKEAKRVMSQAAVRAVGCVFLTAVMPLAFKALADPALRANKLHASTPLSAWCMSVAAGYFLYDVLICTFRFGENNLEFLIHAVLCCAAFSYGALSGNLHYFGAAFLMWELSTPLLYARWFMIKAGAAGGRVMMAVNFAFMAVFFGCRNVFGPIMSYDFWIVSQRDMDFPTPASFSPAVIWGYRAACVCLNSLNLLWFSKMVAMALSPKERTKAGKAV